MAAPSLASGNDNGFDASNQADSHDALPRSVPAWSNVTRVGNGRVRIGVAEVYSAATMALQGVGMRRGSMSAIAITLLAYIEITIVTTI